MSIISHRSQMFARRLRDFKRYFFQNISGLEKTAMCVTRHRHLLAAARTRALRFSRQGWCLALVSFASLIMMCGFWLWLWRWWWWWLWKWYCHYDNKDVCDDSNDNNIDGNDDITLMLLWDRYRKIFSVQINTRKIMLLSWYFDGSSDKETEAYDGSWE